MWEFSPSIFPLILYHVYIPTWLAYSELIKQKPNLITLT